MTSRGLSLPRLLLLAGLIPAASLNGSDPAHQAQPAIQTATTRYDALRPPEVRLRKLHLVRPDLIPYPIEYEVVC
jgi:hypothetical protein